MTASSQGRIADADVRNWVDRYAPAALHPYLRLARADRPIGTWLLLWPCWWGVALAAPTQGAAGPDLGLLVLFGVGAIVMRGAGCTFNDIVDRDIDAQVARTASRPLPSGQVSVLQAWIFLGAQCLAGLIVLLSFNGLTIQLGIFSLVLVAIYPFMKRLTYWPQVFLGLAFNWGALMGWTAKANELTLAPLMLYAGGIAWTIGYDTIYAHQDKDDDALVGVKSTALKFGGATKPWLWFFYSTAFSFFASAAMAVNIAWPFYVGLALAGAQLVWQIRSVEIDNPDSCLQVFRSNRTFGALIFAAIVVGHAW